MSLFSAHQWRKRWFVLDDVALKYYRDSEAEGVSPSSAPSTGLFNMCSIIEYHNSVWHTVNLQYSTHDCNILCKSSLVYEAIHHLCIFWATFVLFSFTIYPYVYVFRYYLPMTKKHYYLKRKNIYYKNKGNNPTLKINEGIVNGYECYITDLEALTLFVLFFCGLLCCSQMTQRERLSSGPV